MFFMRNLAFGVLSFMMAETRSALFVVFPGAQYIVGLIKPLLNKGMN